MLLRVLNRVTKRLSKHILPLALRHSIMKVVAKIERPLVIAIYEFVANG
jgi:hypothetical protein